MSDTHDTMPLLEAAMSETSTHHPMALIMSGMVPKKVSLQELCGHYADIACVEKVCGDDDDDDDDDDACSSWIDATLDDFGVVDARWLEATHERPSPVEATPVDTQVPQCGDDDRLDATATLERPSPVEAMKKETHWPQCGDDDSLDAPATHERPSPVEAMKKETH